MVSDEKRAELLLDHYKDSIQQTGEHWKTRNRLFVYVLITLTLMLFQLTSPNVFEHLANSYIRKQVEAEAAQARTEKAPAETVKTPSNATPQESPAPQGPEANRNVIDFRFITSVLWFVLAYLLVQYYQRSILIDRQYSYLGELEERINGVLGADSVTREGAAYLKARPKYLKHVRYLYGPVFITLLLVVVVSKMTQELYSLRYEWAVLDNRRIFAAISFDAIDVVIALVIGYYTILYVRWLSRNS